MHTPRSLGRLSKLELGPRKSEFQNPNLGLVTKHKRNSCSEEPLQAVVVLLFILMSVLLVEVSTAFVGHLSYMFV